jgi:hypothetical protein
MWVVDKPQDTYNQCNLCIPIIYNFSENSFQIFLNYPISGIKKKSTKNVTILVKFLPPVTAASYDASEFCSTVSSALAW